MPRRFKVAYLAHAIRSDWNNGNAHFLRGLLRALACDGHEIRIFEAADEWSIRNLRTERLGDASLAEFAREYSDLNVAAYSQVEKLNVDYWSAKLDGVEVVIVHEWNSPELAQLLLTLRSTMGFAMLFHDTHHRASSSPDQIAAFGVDQFDGVLAFGEALRRLYLQKFGLKRVWTLHEAADTTVFTPRPIEEKTSHCVWIGNWGEGERAEEIGQFLLAPAAHLSQYRFQVYGVRYPEEGLTALSRAGVSYGGYLPNLSAPRVYGQSQLTFHVPRQQYSQVMDGIPTIRVFEALACGIPLISAPWRDSEGLFREGDFTWARDCAEMKRNIEILLSDPDRASEQAQRGLETITRHHTCTHRAQQLGAIFEELGR